LSKQIETLEMEIHSLKLQIDDRDTTIIDLKSKLKNNEQNEEKEQEMLKLQQRLQNEMNNLKNDYEDTIKKLKDEFNLQSKNNEGSLEARLKAEFEQELQSRLAKAQKNFDYEIEQLNSEHENKVKRVSNELQIQMSDLQITIDQLKQANKKLTSD